MIIVSQNRTAIINFDTIHRITANGCSVWIHNADSAGYESEIGTYDTPERAKEVLKGIAGRYALAAHYYMPEE